MSSPREQRSATCQFKTEPGSLAVLHPLAIDSLTGCMQCNRWHIRLDLPCKCWIVSAWLCVILNMLGSFPVVSIMDMKVWSMLKIMTVCDSCQTESQVVFLGCWDHSPVRKSFKLLEAWAALSVQSSTLQCLVCCEDYIDCILSFTYELSHKRPASNIHKVKPIRSRMGIRNQAQTMSIQ